MTMQNPSQYRNALEKHVMKKRARRGVQMMGFVVAISLGMVAVYGGLRAQSLTRPKYKFDTDWPNPLPNKWKMGGVTGLAVDKNDDVWVLNRPNDLRDLELHAELSTPTADCCVRPPSMI